MHQNVCGDVTSVLFTQAIMISIPMGSLDDCLARGAACMQHIAVFARGVNHVHMVTLHWPARPAVFNLHVDCL
jgi:hypothetical protein